MVQNIRQVRTVSAIRKELGSAIPLYRNSESGLCVPFACRDGVDENLDDPKVLENIGGPGGIRTPDLTVMSGQL